MIYKVKRLIRFDGDGTLKGFCDVECDGVLLIKGIRIVQGKRELFVSMPRDQGKDGRFYDVVEFIGDAEERAKFTGAVLSTYREFEEVKST